MHKEQVDNTLFLATLGVILAETFLFLERFTGGGIVAVVAAVGVTIAFVVLVKVFTETKNDKIKAVLAFSFAGAEFLSAYIIGRMLGSVWFGVVLATIVLLGAIQMTRKASKKKNNKYVKKEKEEEDANEMASEVA